MALIPPSSSRRITSLDVLRGIAISMVLLTHLPFARPSDWFGYGVLRRLILSGRIGVDLFFVLSGFLVAGLLFREYERRGTIDVRRFVLRRGLKIWPAYYVGFGALLVLEVLKPCLEGGSPKFWLVRKTWPSWVFVQNYAHNQWSWSWSLAIEEHFYLFLPLLLLVLLRFRQRGRRTERSYLIVGVICVICFAIGCARTLLSLRYPETTWRPMYFPTHLRADSLLFGVLIAYLFHFHRNWLDRLLPYRVPTIIGALLLLLPVALWPLGTSRYLPSIGFTVLYLAFGGILIVTLLTNWSHCPPRLAKLCRPSICTMRFLGIYSYTIYITHVALYSLVPEANELLRAFLVQRWGCGAYTVTLSSCLVYLTIGIGSGVLLSHLVERPVLAWRERHFGARTDQAAAVPSATAEPAHAHPLASSA